MIKYVNETGAVVMIQDDNDTKPHRILDEEPITEELEEDEEDEQ